MRQPIRHFIFLLIAFSVNNRICQAQARPIIFGSPDAVVLDLAVDEERSFVFSNLAHKIEVWNYEKKTRVNSWNCSKIIAIDYHNGRLAGVSKNGAIVLWDVESGRELLQVNVSSSPLICVSWLGTEFLAAGNDQGEIIRINTSSGEVVSRTRERHAITAISCFKDSLLISGNTKGYISMYSAGNMQLQKTFLGHKRWVREIKINERGTFFLTASDDGAYHVWSADKLSAPVQTAHPGNWLLSADLSDFSRKDPGVKAFGQRNGKVLVYTAFARYAVKLHSIVNCVAVLKNKLPAISVLVGTQGQGLHLLEGKSMKFTESSRRR